LKTELIKFNTKDDLRLEGLVFEPDYHCTQIVVHVHGSGGNFYENKMIDACAKDFTDVGWAFMSFNNRGAEIERIFDDYKTGMIHEEFWDCENDIEAAIAFAKKRGYKDIVLQGHSLGCNKVVGYVLQRGFAGGIILLAPCDLVHVKQLWGKIPAMDQKTRETIWRANAPADMFRYRDSVMRGDVARLKNDIFITIGDEDKYIAFPTSAGQYLASLFSGTSMTFNLIKGAGHQFQEKLKELTKNITAWLLIHAKDFGTKREIIYETERLVIRKWMLTDAADMFEYAADPEVGKYIFPPHKTIEDSIERINDVFRRYGQADRYTMPEDKIDFAIEHKSEQKVVGSISFSKYTERSGGTAEIGYALGAKYWGNGYMTEAVKGMLSFIKKQGIAKRIEARHDTENVASGKVMERAGMKFEVIQKKPSGTNNLRGHGDSVLYSILAEDIKD